LTRLEKFVGIALSLISELAGKKQNFTAKEMSKLMESSTQQNDPSSLENEFKHLV